MASSSATLTYTVRGLKSCSELVKHFSAFPLQGEKKKIFLIFNFILQLLHVPVLTIENCIKILHFSYYMNNQGISRKKSKQEYFSILSKKYPNLIKSSFDEPDYVIFQDLISVKLSILNP